MQRAFGSLRATNFAQSGISARYTACQTSSTPHAKRNSRRRGAFAQALPQLPQLRTLPHPAASPSCGVYSFGVPPFASNTCTSPGPLAKVPHYRGGMCSRRDALWSRGEKVTLHLGGFGNGLLRLTSTGSLLPAPQSSMPLRKPNPCMPATTGQKPTTSPPGQQANKQHSGTAGSSRLELPPPWLPREHRAVACQGAGAGPAASLIRRAATRLQATRPGEGPKSGRLQH